MILNVLKIPKTKMDFLPIRPPFSSAASHLSTTFWTACAISTWHGEWGSCRGASRLRILSARQKDFHQQSPGASFPCSAHDEEQSHFTADFHLK